VNLPTLAPRPISLSEAERDELQIVNRHTTPQQIAKKEDYIVGGVGRIIAKLPES